MKILTVGESPYLLTGLGKIHSSVLQSLVENNHSVLSMVWNHDKTYFMSDGGSFNFQLKNGSKCLLQPFDNEPKSSIRSLSKVLSKHEPELIITIGDYYETDFVHAIKAYYPAGFNWISILVGATYPIEKSHKNALEYADAIISTCKNVHSSVSNLCNVPCFYLPFGPDDSVFVTGGINKDFNIIAVLKNNFNSNIPAFVDGISALKVNDINVYLHTNIHDEGYRDIQDFKNISIPKKFTSINEGLPDDELKQIYTRASLVIDTSMQSALGLAVLEGMSCGCIPILTSAGTLADIIDLFPKRWMHEIFSVPLVGKRNEIKRICLPGDITRKIELFYRIWRKNPKEFEKIRSKSIKVSKKFSRKGFMGKLEEIIIKTLTDSKPLLIVEQ